MISRVDFSTGAAAGGAGVATATGYSSEINGQVLAVYVNFQGAPPAGTTDFTLSDEGDPASESIIALTNTATDIKIYPRRITETSNGTDVLYAAGEEVFDYFPVHGRLEATIAQANDADYVDVTVWLLK